MLRLIKAEFYKLFKNKTFKVLIAFIMVLAIAAAGLMFLDSSEGFIGDNDGAPEQQNGPAQIPSAAEEREPAIKPGESGIQFESSVPERPTGKETFQGAFGGGLLEIFFVVLTAALVVGEYAAQTIKNILAYGNKREHYYLSKFIALCCGMVIITGLMAAVPTLAVTLKYGWGAPFSFGEAAWVLKIFFSKTIVGAVILSIVMLIATLSRHYGATVALGIVLFTVSPSFLGFFVGKYAWFDKLYKLTPLYNWPVITAVGAADSHILTAVKVSILSLIILLGMGVLLFKKQDVA